MGSLGPSALPNSSSNANGNMQTSRASELEGLLKAVLQRLIPFVEAADTEYKAHITNAATHKSTLVDYRSPEELTSILSSTLALPSNPLGQQGILSTLESILKYSVNTSAPGFLDKLYSAPVAPGVAAELILSVLNTNLHVYQVSPVLTLIEKHVSKSLAALFGFTGPRSGGISVQGGSASNTTSIVIARNTLYPRTKTEGNNAGGLKLALFTSAHGHYSIEKAAQMCGFGSASAIPVPIDKVTGRMIPSELERLVLEAKARGETPFYVNATAGSTVLGSFDPFQEISQIAKRHSMWFHIDGAWGGSFVFSEKLRRECLAGAELADSIAINPHKMMGVPVTCSFLLGKDMQHFHQANTLRAGYLFHDTDEDGADGSTCTWKEPYDLADMTLQCGRRGDSLKLFLAWQYYGSGGYAHMVERAHSVAAHMVAIVAKHDDFKLVSTDPPPCLQVCFNYAPRGRDVFGTEEGQIAPPGLESLSEQDTNRLVGVYNSKITERITRTLVSRGFMIDYAPALEGREAEGKFFRAVVNIQTPKETVERLVAEISDIGEAVVRQMRERHTMWRKLVQGWVYLELDLVVVDSWLHLDSEPGVRFALRALAG
ncbi:hypothetical protein Dda_5608 [Drechslerella dactyloides]|uniref:Glutamate decarboxylase n=1 Tax=Drechslerella dactyloides TaxID=74499 RepID=A0AAD6IWI0_DREDA|nr:hypothetical protein Dda_5608 [Drechslerella dactyloides]